MQPGGKELVETNPYAGDPYIQLCLQNTSIPQRALMLSVPAISESELERRRTSGVPSLPILQRLGISGSDSLTVDEPTSLSLLLHPLRL